MSKQGKSDKLFKQALMMELANQAGGASAMKMRDKPFKQALLMEAKALENGKPGNYPKGSLRAIAQALLFRASDGDVAAIREVADRLDGRVPQAVGGSDELGPQRITVTWRETPLEQSGSGS
jgi:hypothetical protein